MNRQQRRAASKAQDTQQVAERSADKAIVGRQSKPGLGVRIAAFVLLSSWVLRRVRNPQVLVMLQEVARQARHEKAVLQLEERINALR